MVEIEAASRNHSAIVVNLVREASSRLQGTPCQVYSQNLRVYLPSVNECAYPDLLVTCGQENFAASSTLLNPLTVVEVLSPSTEHYDQGTKFAHYRSVPSLREYITVTQDRVEIHHWSKVAKWMLHASYTSETDCLQFAHYSLNIPVIDIYRNVVWEYRDEFKKITAS
jgi:Uma2 family endonuclease